MVGAASDDDETPVEATIMSHPVTQIGDDKGTIEASIGARFLQLFSDQLYTSPNKAFEELVSNSWDAGAANIRIGTSRDLTPDAACLWVLDDGISMDAHGLQELWHIASSPKADPGYNEPAGRPPIGKFGIGKLATYALAHELTYICRAGDGVIRAVTLDFRNISDQPDGQLHVEKVELKLRALSDEQLRAVLTELGDERLASVLPDGTIALPADADGATDEFGGSPTASPAPSSTWTLVVLTDLKDKGKALRRGTVKRMLRAALPLGDQVKIAFDSNAPLASSKFDVPVMEQWSLGDETLELTEVTLAAPADDDGDDNDTDGNLVLADDVDETTATDLGDHATQGAVDPSTADAGGEPRTLTVTRSSNPKGIRLEGFPGNITGQITIYEKSIQGKKSDRRAPSNGFQVNVRGRVVNVHDNSFGLPALSHTVWSKLRVTIRADGLHEHLAVSREGVFEGEHAEAFRALLRTIFNLARKVHDDAEQAKWPEVHQIVVGEYGTVPLTPLLDLVAQSLNDGGDTAGIVGFSQMENPKEAGERFAQEVAEDPSKAIGNVVILPLDAAEELVRYDFDLRQVVVNASHPFVREFAQRSEQQELLQRTGLVELLSDAYLLQDLDFDVSQLRRLRDYRDRLTRLLARKRRQNASTLAEILISTSRHDKAFEVALGDSLEALGFKVVRQGGSNQPEGLATAALPPKPDDPKHPAGEDELRREYRFVYEAKSSSQTPQKVSTKDVNVSGQKRHRNNAAADTTDPDHPFEYILVVAPAYAAGALEEEAKEDGVCPMRAETLARLLMATVATGPLDLVAFRRVLEATGPDDVEAAVATMIDKATKATHVNLPEVLDAIEKLDTVDALTSATIAKTIRDHRGGDARRPSSSDITRMLGGLSLLVPEALNVEGENILLGASPARLAEAVRERMSRPPIKGTLKDLGSILGDVADPSS